VKRKWKILIIVAAVLIAVVGVYASTVYSKRGVVTVQTGNRGMHQNVPVKPVVIESMTLVGAGAAKK
jgi:flagellar basal body-associated protein FliL